MGNDLNIPHSGSTEAADELIRQFMKHQHLLLSYISTILRDYHKAEDILQETASVLIRRAEEYQGTQNFWRLAREIARRQAIAALQKSSRHPTLVPDEVLDIIEAQFDTLQHDEREYKAVLLKCIQRLPDTWQQMITERYWNQVQVKKIAAGMKRSSKTVTVALVRARARFAECVERSQRRRGLV